MEIFQINQMIEAIKKKPKTHNSFIIGIDGCGGSGKSTLAERLKETFTENVFVVHMDDFYLPSEQRKHIENTDDIGKDFDWKRLLNQVILPLSKGLLGKYQRYDWNTDTLTEWNTVSGGSIVIIEGVYTLRTELFRYYDYTIWVDTPNKIRLQRGIDRDGENMRTMWEDTWMPAEEQYVKIQKPYERANIIIDGSGQ
ncbi:AAA family ATPase [Paenibacillus sp. FSL M7-0802]|uniref:uridine kinase family protein n=1 Tax=Paenibacillus TaxID=44249 RepID=UPI00048DB8E5|nr:MULTISPECIES: AAA family ATPase [Paenibacillus]OMF75788.1 hypothetical protein BK143_05345 [Paenibacillus peoriae]SFR02488.1 Uridine kinase [Paenibacillus sp. cl130]